MTSRRIQPIRRILRIRTATRHPRRQRAANPVAYKAKGTIKAIDPATEKLTVTVGSRPGDTNAHARSWAGNDVSFDLNGAI